MNSLFRPPLRRLGLALVLVASAAACSAKLSGPTPIVDSVTPSLVCTEQLTTAVAIAGDGLSPLAIDSATGDPLLALPDVALTRVQDLTGAPLTGEPMVVLPNDPQNPAAAHVRWTSARSMAFDVYPELLLAQGRYRVTVTNRNGNTASLDAAITAVAAPRVTAIAPPAICDLNQPPSLEITGEGFLVIDGVNPTVTVDGMQLLVTATAGCQAIPGTMPAAQLCTSITVEVPAGGFALGAHELVVANPPPANCAAASFPFTVAGAPTVTSVTPFKVCADGGQFAVGGTGFVGGSQISVSPSGGGASTDVPTTFVTDMQVDGTMSTGLVPAGLYDVTVENGEGCSATLPDSLRVVDAPFVFYADPPNVYNGINLQITIYASGINDDVLAVGIRPAGSMSAPTPLVYTYDLARPNRILATVPAGTAAGDYDIVIQDTVCGAELLNGLHVTDMLIVDVSAIDPPFGSTVERASVTIRSSSPPPPGTENFAATPRAYLNPIAPGALARELVGVQFQDPLRLSATVPDGLATGSYDVVVINPDGKVGLLPGAFTVVADPLPQIDSLTPGSIINQPAQSVTIRGTNFRGPVTVGTSCVDQGGAAVPSPPVVIGATTPTSVVTTFDASTVPGGTVCVVRVTNVDGTFADFSALSVTTPSANLNPFQASTSMTVPRRAAAAAALRLNGVQRFVFAIGGDAGTVGTELETVEAAPVDAFGVVGTWSAQLHALPAGRSFTAAATVGRYVYLPGGTAAGVAATSVLRAYLLDPFEAPAITDLDLALGMGAGLDAGIYYYRVAAVMDPSDPNNPGGEGLASEPLVVQAPDLPSKVHLTLYWSEVPGAVAYRIYRSPTPGLIAGSELMLMEVPAVAPGTQSFTDTGLTITPGASPPLPVGTLGAWHQIGTLATGREGAGVVAVPDPNVPGRTYLYVLGGRNPAGAVVNSYEWTVITTAAPAAQTISGFTSGSLGAFTARWQGGAVYTDATKAPSVPAGDAWVYGLPGFTAAMANVTQVVAFQVDTVNGAGADDGSLGTVTPVSSNNIGGGYGYVAGNDFLYTFGGGTTPTSTGKSAKICAPGEAGCAGGAPEPPDLVNWNAGISLVEARTLQGTASESGFVFQVGGTTSAGAASTTTERTNF